MLRGIRCCAAGRPWINRCLRRRCARNSLPNFRRKVLAPTDTQQLAVPFVVEAAAVCGCRVQVASLPCAVSMPAACTNVAVCMPGAHLQLHTPCGALVNATTSQQATQLERTEDGHTVQTCKGLGLQAGGAQWPGQRCMPARVCDSTQEVAACGGGGTRFLGHGLQALARHIHRRLICMGASSSVGPQSILRRRVLFP